MPQDEKKKPITCGKCSQYSRSLGRCVLGKVNPRTRKNTKSAMSFYQQVTKICFYNPWREAVAHELGLMHCPEATRKED